MLLIPNKFMNFDTCILKISGEILEILMKNKRKKYSVIYKKFYTKYNEDTDYIFLPALNFLYLLGKIKYDLKKDTLELII